MGYIEETIRRKALELRSRLEKIEGLTLYYPSTSDSGIITVDSRCDPITLKQTLWKEDNNGNQFEVSIVPATSTPLDSARSETPDLVRVSVSYTTTCKEMDLLCKRLSAMLLPGL